jgi:MFS family permease
MAEATAQVQPVRDPIWTSRFVLLCSAAFFANAHQALLQPALPLYASHLGASPLVIGLLIATFSISSIIVRPAIGMWTDLWSVPGVLALGCVLLGSSALLFLIPIIPIMFAVNSVRGVGWAGLNTGNFTLLAQTAPPTRRGEASGYFSSVQGTVTVLFPALALWIIGTESEMGRYGAVLVLAGVTAFLGAVVGFFIMRTQAATRQRPPAGPRAKQPLLTQFFDPSVLLAFALLLCVVLSQPAITTFLVLYARKLGIADIGWYFVVSGITGVISRPFVGRLSDRLGQAPSLVTGFALNIVGVVLIAVSQSLVGLAVGGIFGTLGSETVMATSTALAMDRADPQRPGRAMATFSQAYQVGVGSGSLIAGAIANFAGFQVMYFVMAGIVAIGLALTLANWAGLRRPAPSPV